MPAALLRAEVNFNQLFLLYVVSNLLCQPTLNLKPDKAYVAAVWKGEQQRCQGGGTTCEFQPAMRAIA
eukprot:5603627-Amphidinium_carterae.1